METIKSNQFFSRPFSNKFAWLGAFGVYNIGCKRNLYLKNGL